MAQSGKNTYSIFQLLQSRHGIARVNIYWMYKDQWGSKKTFIDLRAAHFFCFSTFIIIVSVKASEIILKYLLFMFSACVTPKIECKHWVKSRNGEMYLQLRRSCEMFVKCCDVCDDVGKIEDFVILPYLQMESGFVLGFGL